MSYAPTVFDYVCSNADKFAMLLAFECLAGFLSILLFFWSEPRTATHVVSILNVFGAGILSIGTAALLVRCHRT